MLLPLTEKTMELLVLNSLEFQAEEDLRLELELAFSKSRSILLQLGSYENISEKFLVLKLATAEIGLCWEDQIFLIGLYAGFSTSRTYVEPSKEYLLSALGFMSKNCPGFEALIEQC